MASQDQLHQAIIRCFVESGGDKALCLESLAQVLPDKMTPEVFALVLLSQSLVQALYDVLRRYGAPDSLLRDVRHAEEAAGLRKKPPQVHFLDPPLIRPGFLRRLPAEALAPLPSSNSKPKPDPNERPKDMAEPKKTAEEKENDRIVSTLDITRHGSSLVLPEGLDTELAIRALQRKQATEEEMTSFSHNFGVSVPEGIVAFLRVLKKEFGFVSTRPNFFGVSRYLTIEVAPGVKESVPWGDLEVPNVDGLLRPGFAMVRDQVVFSISGQIKGKSRAEASRICNLVEAECKGNSIYKGQIIQTAFPSLKNDEVDSLEASFPRFVDVPEYNEGQLIFPRSIEEQIEANVFTPIKKTDRCRREGISLKRSALFYGVFGVGKTLTATVTANLCKKHGWTFIYLTDVTRMAQAYDFARQYQPAVIFSEDVDKALGGARDLDMDKILNKMDGIDTKGIEVITIMTTNKMEEITQAALRPGRFDALIHVTPPDAEAVTRLIKFYAKDKMAPDQDLTEVGRLLEGAIPAFIEEVVKRSKLAALRRDDEVVQLRAEDFLVVAEGMKAHLKLLEPQVEDERSTEERSAQLIADAHVQAARIRAGLPEEQPNGKTLARREHRPHPVA